ncbi:hypothetical protein GJ496_002118 [Pomphorhynchus laevis]|nr:hypothetical protein GJ496_002118 [Pomphorhynchus laevis]
MKMPTVPRGGNVHTDNAAGQQVHPSKLTCRFCDDILQTRYQLRQHENEHMGKMKMNFDFNHDRHRSS